MFTGWKMVAVAFWSCFVSVGFVYYAYGVFFKSVMTELGGSRFAVSTGLPAMNFAVAMISPFIGRALDRGGHRQVMCVGALLLSLGFGLGAQAHALWQFQLVFGTLMGAAVCMLGPLASSALVANWFVAKRGVALSYATMGIAASGVLVPLAITPIIAACGWRWTFVACGALSLFVLAPVLHFSIVGRPEEIGEHPDGAATAPLDSVEPAPFRPWEVVRTPNFIAITLVIGLNACCMQGLTTHLVPYLTDRGWTPADAALALSLMAFSGLLGRPLFGRLLDRLPLRSVALVAILLQITGLLIILSDSGTRRALPGLSVLALGMGCLMPLQGAMIGATFGREVFGRVMGIMSPAMFPIINIGVPLAGWTHDARGEYREAFLVFLGLYVASIGALSLLRMGSRAPLARPSLT